MVDLETLSGHFPESSSQYQLGMQGECPLSLLQQPHISTLLPTATVFDFETFGYVNTVKTPTAVCAEAARAICRAPMDP